MRSSNDCNRRSALSYGRGVSTGRGDGRSGGSRRGGGRRGGSSSRGNGKTGSKGGGRSRGGGQSRGRRGRLHPRLVIVPSVGLGHSRMFGLGGDGRGEVGRFSSQGEVK